MSLREVKKKRLFKEVVVVRADRKVQEPYANGTVKTTYLLKNRPIGVVISKGRKVIKLFQVLPSYQPKYRALSMLDAFLQECT